MFPLVRFRTEHASLVRQRLIDRDSVARWAIKEFPIYSYPYKIFGMAKASKDANYIGRRIRLRDLHVFLTVTQRGSMAKAALDLGITQPAVSRVIAELEHALGARLLDRSSQGVEATLYGRALLKRSGVAFDELKQAIRDIEFLANPNIGEVRIGCPESIVAAILPPVIERLFRRYPGIVPIVSEAVAPSLDFSELRARKVDLVLARLVSPVVSGQSLDDLNVKILFDDAAVIAAGAESRWARRRKIDLADLAEGPWILTEPNTWNNAIVAKAFAARGLKMPKISLMTLSVHLRTNLVASGDFITVFPRSVMDLYARRFSLKVLPIDFPAPPWPVAVVTLKNRTPSAVVELFIEHLQAFTKSLAGRPIA
jgi:DNA-binding transcriptional LysR family regulator